MALPVITQLATARILQKQHGEGRISDAEWERRKREPMHFFLPVSLRPYLNQEWVEKGGLAEVFLSVNLFFCTLPFIPTVPEYGPKDGKALLSDGRFLLRCNHIKRQMSSYMQHPLFLEIVEAGLQQSVAKRRLIAYQGYGQAPAPTREGELVPSVFGEDTTYMIGVSSGGNVRVAVCSIVCKLTYAHLQYDLLQPSDYPSSSSDGETRDHSPKAGEHREARLHIASWETHLHVRPAYLYLGALTTQNRLSFLLSWDGNVYDQDLVHEWFKEVENVLMWYLARK